MSGKGLNVARTLHLARRPVSAILPIGKEDEHLLFRTPYPQILRMLPIAGRVRVNTTVVEADGQTTNINQQAVPISGGDWNRVCDLTVEQLEEMDADWLVVSGMHPINTDTGDFVELTALFERARELGVRVAVDTSGPTLTRWGRSPLVNLIKPNADELATLVGHNLHTIGDALDAGRELCAQGIEIALVSLGADGALGITADEAHWAHAVATEVVNTTGAGDATLAGFLASSLPSGSTNGQRPPLDIPAGLTTAVSWGALAVSLPTTLISSFDAAPTSVVEDIDRDRPLAEPTHLTI
jgi:1-phosphofructokinase